jgi:broad specificity phosphatase PhoE
MKILFIRHGQTTGDLEDRFGGDYDDHLTDEGKEQVQSLIKELQDNDIQIILCSSLIRARETSEIISGGNIPIEVEKNLKERHQYGILTGEIKSEMKIKHPDLVEKAQNYRNTIDGAESYEDFTDRIQKAFTRITADSSHDCIAVVWHGGPMRVLFRDILQLGELGHIGDCAWVELEKQHDQFLIKDSRRTEFLF